MISSGIPGEREAQVPAHLRQRRPSCFLGHVTASMTSMTEKLQDVEAPVSDCFNHGFSLHWPLSSSTARPLGVYRHHGAKMKLAMASSVHSRLYFGCSVLGSWEISGLSVPGIASNIVPDDRWVSMTSKWATAIPKTRADSMGMQSGTCWLRSMEPCSFSQPLVRQSSVISDESLVSDNAG